MLGSAGAELKVPENDNHTMRTATTLLLSWGDAQLGHNGGRKMEISSIQYTSKAYTKEIMNAG